MRLGCDPALSAIKIGQEENNIPGGIRMWTRSSLASVIYRGPISKIGQVSPGDKLEVFVWSTRIELLYQILWQERQLNKKKGI
jgi:hypothetical protein